MPDEKGKIIYLTGFMGSGKSTAGKIAAEKLNIDFIDLDKYIEEKEGRSISEIFSEKSEAYFREIEHKYLKEIYYGNSKNILVALGGGTVMNPINMQIIKNNSIVIFLDTPFDTIKSRVQSDPSRPLAVKYKTPVSFKNLFDSRRPVYLNSCSYIINCLDLPPEAVADKIVSNIITNI